MQTPLIVSLQSPDCYPHAVDTVELIETHISWVLLAGNLVYKLKKPRDLGFLDFSTLDKREFFCREELRLNRRTAPALYIDVIPICGTPGRPLLGGSGTAIDYAVQMRRFDRDAGFDRLLTRGDLQATHTIDLARALAQLHDVADVASHDSHYGSFDAVAGPLRDNFVDLARTLAGKPIEAALSPIRTWAEAQLSALAPVLEQRRRTGFIRECHGDAHLANVALIDGRATLFDCIEFSDDLRWIDVMSDLAFTIMDLHSRGAPGLAWLLLDEYLAVTGDYAGLALLPLYLVHRALVRAKVYALRLDDENAEAVMDSVAEYLAVASRFTHETRGAIVITVGVSGSGKSWLAEKLVERVGLVRLRSDIERKRLHGYEAHESSASDVDSDLYTAEATQRTYRHLVHAARSPLSTGTPVLIDAANLQQWQRHLFSELAAELRVPFTILYCQAEDALLRKRIVERENAGEDPSEAGLAVLDHQQESLEPLTPDERSATLFVDTAAENPDSVADRLMRRRE